MSTTSLKLPDDLEQRAAAAARELGMTPHAFMVEAIQRAALAAEQRAEFVDQAIAARNEMLHTNEGFGSGELRAYLRNRIDNKDVEAPSAKPWRK